MKYIPLRKFILNIIDQLFEFLIIILFFLKKIRAPNCRENFQAKLARYGHILGHACEAQNLIWPKNPATITSSSSSLPLSVLVGGLNLSRHRRGRGGRRWSLVSSIISLGIAVVAIEPPLLPISSQTKWRIESRRGCRLPKAGSRISH